MIPPWPRPAVAEPEQALDVALLVLVPPAAVVAAVVDALARQQRPAPELRLTHPRQARPMRLVALPPATSALS